MFLFSIYAPLFSIIHVNTLIFHKDTPFTIANTSTFLSSTSLLLAKPFPQPLMIETFNYQSSLEPSGSLLPNKSKGSLTCNCMLLTTLWVSPVKTLTIAAINTNFLLYTTFLTAFLASITALGSSQFHDFLILALLSPQSKPISNLEGPNSWLEHILCTVLQFQHL